MRRNEAGAVRRGFTIVEVIVIVVILGILAAVIAPRIISRIGDTKQGTAASNAAVLATATKLLIADCGMPEAGSAITILWEKPSWAKEGAWKGPYVDNQDQLKDPWGNLYILQIPGQKNVDFDIVSYGRDSAPGGDGENADVIKP